MNADLAKVCVYDKLTLKRVTVLADVGNKAAPGEDVNDADVSDMIVQVERFVSDYPVA
jgi:hypothetical protein